MQSIHSSILIRHVPCDNDNDRIMLISPQIILTHMPSGLTNTYCNMELMVAYIRKQVSLENINLNFSPFYIVSQDNMSSVTYTHGTIPVTESYIQRMPYIYLPQRKLSAQYS